MNLTDTLQLSILTEVTKNLVESTFNRFQLDPFDYDYSELEDLRKAAEAVGKDALANRIAEHIQYTYPQI